MGLLTDSFDLGRIRLASGEGRRVNLNVDLGSFVLGDEEYPVVPNHVPVRLDISRTTGQGYALRLRFNATLEGPCMRCLEPAAPAFDVDAVEVSQPEADAEELDSPYVQAGVLDIGGWARDALALVIPAAVLCGPDCAGLCPICGEDLNRAAPDHHHARPPDPRWAKLSDLQLETAPEES